MKVNDNEQVSKYYLNCFRNETLEMRWTHYRNLFNTESRTEISFWFFLLLTNSSNKEMILEIMVPSRSLSLSLSLSLSKNDEHFKNKFEKCFRNFFL